MLFIIPVGGGIPAGVVLAQSKGIGWLTMTILYLISDILLAFCFEPVMKLFFFLSHRVPFLAHIRDVFKKTNEIVLARYGEKPSPLTLVGIAFGVDPMTGRAAALAAGHNFVTGWAIAILGDMFFFAIIMISTIWLNEILGDGTWAAVIVMIAMFVIPELVRRLRQKPGS